MFVHNYLVVSLIDDTGFWVAKGPVSLASSFSKWGSNFLFSWAVFDPKMNKIYQYVRESKGNFTSFINVSQLAFNCSLMSPPAALGSEPLSFSCPCPQAEVFSPGSFTCKAQQATSCSPPFTLDQFYQ
jgi:hypothetical protein